MDYLHEEKNNHKIKINPAKPHSPWIAILFIHLLKNESARLQHVDSI